MIPTINEDGDRVLVDIFSYKCLNKKYQNGDVVISHSPTNLDKNVCKRICAVEGESVYFQGRKITIPKSHVWLLGDNADNSNDSRNYGPISTGLLIGRAIGKLNFSIPPYSRL